VKKRDEVVDKLYSKLQQKVLKFAVKNDFFMLINHGAKRSGKTIVDNDLFLLELKRVRRMADEAGIDSPQYILAGADLSSLQRNVLIEIANKYHIEFKFDKYNRFEMFGVMVCCFGHSKINDLSRIRGMTAWGAYINEATMANEQVFDEIKSRCSAPGARIIMDTNPDRPGHWLKRDYIDKADQKTIAAFHWTIDDNTFLTPDYIAKQKETTPSGMLYERGINGAWVAGEGVVYPDFDRDVHYIHEADVPLIKEYWAGQDFGWEHTGAIVLFGLGFDGNTYLLKEWSGKHKNISEWASIVKDKIEPKIYKDNKRLTVYCDSARPDLIEELKCAGVDARNANKDVMAGISEVATMLKNKTLFIIEENVERFDEEIDTYCWKTDADEPIKQHDDVMDAVRYGIYTKKAAARNSAKLNDEDYLLGGW
jgi:PBSX family phage terminase large subunit